MGYVFHLPRLAQIMNAAWTVLVILFCTHQIFEYSQREFWDFLEMTLFATGFLMILILIGKCSILEYDKKNPIGARERCLRDYKIGCGGSIIFAIIPIVIICIGPKLPFGFMAFVTCNTSSLFLYFLFSWEVEKHHRLVHSWKTSGIVFIFYFCAYTMTFVLLNKSTSFRAYKKNPYIIFAISIYLIPLFLNTSCFVELLMCRMASLNKENKGTTVEMKEMRKANVEDSEGGNTPNQMISRSEGVVRSEVRITIQEESNQETDSQLDGLECDICFMKFDERIPKQTPRILIGCGHTVCEGCIESLLKQNNDHYIICPFCQIVTVAHGRSACQLPKNYGMLKFIQ